MLRIDIELAVPAMRQTVLFEPGLCSDWKREVERRVASQSYLAVVDANLARLLKLPPSGTMQGKWRYLWAAAGEERKNLEQFAELADAALDFGPDSDTVLTAVGGGTIGDLTGLLAALLFRGMRFVFIPTTLVSQIDTAIGGKNGLNTRHRKNALGTVLTPELVMIDSGLLETLPPSEYRHGLAEVVKTALLDDRDFFEELQTSAALLASGNQGFISGIVARCCRSKAGLVLADPAGLDKRKTLAVGHYFGHVLEALAGFDGRVPHGEAVSVGLALACDFSAERGLMPVRSAGEVKNLLAAFHLPVSIARLGAGRPNPPDWERLLSGNGVASALVCGMKTVDGRMRIALPVDIGDCRNIEGIAVEDVARFLRRAGNF